MESIRKYLSDLGKWGWGVMAVNIFTAYSAYSAITGNPILSVPLWIWITLLIIGLITAPFFAFRKIETKLDRIKNARPNIVFAEIENVQTPIRNVNTGVIYGKPCFTQVKFTNDPLTSLQAIDAKNVAGHIDIYNQESQHLFYMIGRWSETKEEALGGQPTEMEQISIPANGRPCPMDIVLKYREDEECYGHTNKSRRLAPVDWRDKQKSLPVGTYSVRVRLRGSNMDDKVFWFELVNKGKGEDIKLRVAVNVPSIPYKEGSQN